MSDSLCHVQLGLEMLISHPGNDPTSWGVTQIFYNGQLFQNTTQLNSAFFDTTSGLNRQQVTPLNMSRNTGAATVCLSASCVTALGLHSVPDAILHGSANPLALHPDKSSLNDAWASLAERPGHLKSDG